MTAALDIVARLRELARYRDDPSGCGPPDATPQLCADAAAEIERLRVACAGGLTVAERMTDECVRLRERCDQLARGQITLRQRLDATRARFADVATIAENAIALAREINRDLLASRIGFGK